MTEIQEKRNKILAYGIGGLVFAAAIWGLSSWNRIQTVYSAVERSWAHYEYQIQRRNFILTKLIRESDLIVDGLESARSESVRAVSLDQKIEKSILLNEKVRRLMGYVQNLKASKQSKELTALSKQIAAIDSKIQLEQVQLNANIQLYNELIHQFFHQKIARWSTYTALPDFNFNEPPT